MLELHHKAQEEFAPLKVYITANQASSIWDTGRKEIMIFSPGTKLLRSISSVPDGGGPLSMAQRPTELWSNQHHLHLEDLPLD
jgi:hypothetical protein